MVDRHVSKPIRSVSQKREGIRRKRIIKEVEANSLIEAANEPLQMLVYPDFDLTKGEFVKPKPPAISIEDLLKMRKRIGREADTLLKNKGNDYNSQQQKDGDTLFNLRICAMLGIVPSPIDGLLVRIGDKFARLISLTRSGATQKVKDESIEDTIKDMKNYEDYLLAFYKESKGQKIE